MMSSAHSGVATRVGVDVIVIGGGAVGCAAAYYLAQGGASVTVIDRAGVGLGASFGNAGQITPSDCIPLAAPGVVASALRWSMQKDAPFSMRSALSPGKLIWLARFARAARRDVSARIEALRDLGRLSMDCLDAIHANESIDCGLSKTGVLNVYESKSGLAGGLRDAALLRHHGIAAQEMTNGEARELEPAVNHGLHGAVYFPDDAYCDPYRYVLELARLARTSGADVRDDIGVLRIARDNGVLAVHTSAGILRAERVVIAAGVGLPRLARNLGASIPIVSGKGYSIDARVPELPRVPLLFIDRRVAVTPVGGLARFAGLMDIGNDSIDVAPKRRSYLERTARGSLARPDVHVERAWAGLRPCTPDGVPVIGFLGGRADVLVAGGHAMVGMSMAAGTGKIVGDLLLGRGSPIDLRGFAAGRFRGA